MTILGQLPFMLFTEIARTWAVQRDSVNTAIIHSYSTLPRNGRIHGLSKELQVYVHGLSDRSVLSESARFKDRGPNRSSRKSWRRSSENRCRWSETILCCVSDFNQTDFSLRPFGAEGTGKDPPKDTWSFHLRHYRLWISSLDRFSLKWRSPERSDIERRYA